MTAPLDEPPQVSAGSPSVAKPRTAAIVALVWSAVTPLLSWAIAAHWSPWTGGSSGVVGLVVMAAWLGLTVLFAATGVVLAIVALRRSPRRIALVALALNCIVPLWILVGLLKLAVDLLSV